MRTATLLLVVTVALWVITAAAATAIWRGVDRGKRPQRDLAGALAGLAACSAGVLTVVAAGAV